MFSSDLKSQLVETSETTFLWSSLHPASALTERREETGRVENREETGGQGTLARIYGCVPALNVQRTANVTPPLRQRAMLGVIGGLAGSGNTTASRTELKRAAAALLRQSQQQQQQQKGLKIQPRQRGRPTETGNVSLRQRRGGETPGKTPAKEACCFCLAQRRSFSSLVTWTRNATSV